MKSGNNSPGADLTAAAKAEGPHSFAAAGSAAKSVAPGGAPTLVCWVCLTLAATFVMLMAGTAPSEFQDAPVAMARYLFYLTPAAIGAGVVCGALLLLGLSGWLACLSLTAGFCYLSAFAVIGLAVAPWLAVGLALAAAMFLRDPIQASGLLLLTHVMGTLTGMQVALRLPVYLEGREPFVNILRGFWWLLSA